MATPLMTTPLMITPVLPTLTPAAFIARWQDAGFGERQGAQSFFNDLCAFGGASDAGGGVCGWRRNLVRLRRL